MTTVFGYLWEKGWLKNNSIGFSVWLWIARQWWYQWFLIPYHCVMGIHYGYEWNSILNFCRKVVR